MLMRTGVCASALEEISEQAAPPYAKIIHDTIAEFLAAHGLLVMSNPKEILDLVKLATASPTIGLGARQTWSVVIQELRKQGRIQVLDPGSPHSLAEITTSGQLCQTWTGNEAPTIAMVPDALLRQIFPATAGTVRDPSTGVVLANPSDFLESLPVQGLKTLLEESRLPLGTTRKSYWDGVLGPLAKASKEITIFDRYLFSELVRRSQLPPSPTEPNEALVWILRLMDTHGNSGLVVRLLAGTAAVPQSGNAQQPVSAQQAAQLLRSAWNRASGGAIARVEVIMGPWYQGGMPMPHDRHVRFGGNRAISVPAGFDRLKKPTIEDSAGMAWHYHWKVKAVDPLIASERILESGPSTSMVTL